MHDPLPQMDEAWASGCIRACLPPGKSYQDRGFDQINLLNAQTEETDSFTDREVGRSPRPASTRKVSFGRSLVLRHTS